jgi:hypothetical protein
MAKKLKVISRYSAVVDGGTTVPPGSVLSLDEEEARSLLERGLADLPEPQDGSKSAAAEDDPAATA